MVVLDRIDPRRCRLAWAHPSSGRNGQDDLARVERRLGAMGVLQRSLLAADAAVDFDHGWELRNGSVEYRSRVSLVELSTREFAFYAAALLATVTWARVEELMAVHLALYELIVNVHEHGRALAGQAPELRLRLRISHSEIEGWLEDGCERFGLDDRAPIDIASRVARRERRGYGVAMIERALDEISYGFGPEGNVVHFRKRIQA